MAAFGFFRKRQKLVFWIMVGLMLIFLLGGTGQFLHALLAPNPDRQVLGRVDGQDLTRGHLRQGQEDMELLAGLGLGNVLRAVVQRALPGEPGLAGEEGFILLMQNEDPALVWQLLLREAEGMGIQVGEPSVDALLAQLGVDQSRLDQLLARLRERNITEKDLRNAVRNYLRIAQAFDAVGKGVQFAEPELRQFYRDTNRTITLAMVEFPASAYVEQLEPLSQDELDRRVEELFRRGRGYRAGDPQAPMGFGYYQPARAVLEYVLVDHQKVRDRVQVDEARIYRRWNEVKDQGVYMRTIQEPATAPADTQSDEDAAQPAADAAPDTVTRQVPATELFDVYDQIREDLRDEAARERVATIAEQVLTLARQAQETPDGKSVLEQAAERLTQTGVPVTYRRMGQAMSFEEMGQDPLLSMAYAGSARQRIELHWIVFSAQPLRAEGLAIPPMVEVGQVYGRPLSVGFGGTDEDKLIWRIVEARPAHAPAELTVAIRRQVEQDVALARAYEEARGQADIALKRALEAGLAQAAQDAGRQLRQTEPLAQKQIQDTSALQLAQTAMQILSIGNPELRQMFMEYSGGLGRFAQSLRESLLETAPQTVSGVAPPLTETFLEQAFALAPADDDPIDLPTQPAAADDRTTPSATTTDADETAVATAPAAQTQPGPTSLPAQPEAIRIIELPAQQTVFLVQRLAYSPGYEDQYLQRRAMLLYALSEMHGHGRLVAWYAQSQVAERTGFLQEQGQ